MTDESPFSKPKGIVLAAVIGVLAVGMVVLVVLQLNIKDPMWDRHNPRFTREHPAQPGQFEVESLGKARSGRSSPPVVPQQVPVRPPTSQPGE